MVERTEEIHVRVTLTWDDEKEDREGVLAATFAGMAEGIANKQTSGKLPNDGLWSMNMDHIMRGRGKS